MCIRDRVITTPEEFDTPVGQQARPVAGAIQTLTVGEGIGQETRSRQPLSLIHI